MKFRCLSAKLFILFCFFTLVIAFGFTNRAHAQVSTDQLLINLNNNIAKLKSAESEKTIIVSDNYYGGKTDILNLVSHSILNFNPDKIYAVNKETIFGLDRPQSSYYGFEHKDTKYIYYKTTKKGWTKLHPSSSIESLSAKYATINPFVFFNILLNNVDNAMITTAYSSDRAITKVNVTLKKDFARNWDAFISFANVDKQDELFLNTLRANIKLISATISINNKDHSIAGYSIDLSELYLKYLKEKITEAQKPFSSTGIKMDFANTIAGLKCTYIINVKFSRLNTARKIIIPLKEFNLK